jgi:hypothetical protein
VTCSREESAALTYNMRRDGCDGGRGRSGRIRRSIGIKKSQEVRDQFCPPAEHHIITVDLIGGGLM